MVTSAGNDFACSAGRHDARASGTVHRLIAGAPLAQA
jgi:hypothetical protein